MLAIFTEILPTLFHIKLEIVRFIVVLNFWKIKVKVYLPGTHQKSSFQTWANMFAHRMENTEHRYHMRIWILQEAPTWPIHRDIALPESRVRNGDFWNNQPLSFGPATLVHHPLLIIFASFWRLFWGLYFNRILFAKMG